MKTNRLDVIKNKFSQAVSQGEALLDTAKNTVVHPKVDVSLSVNNRKKQKNLCDASFRFDKEFSLLSLVGKLLIVFAAIGMLSAALECLFEPSASSKDGE